jgi:hypothetical protein
VLPHSATLELLLLSSLVCVLRVLIVAVEFVVVAMVADVVEVSVVAGAEEEVQDSVAAVHLLRRAEASAGRRRLAQRR